MLIILVFFSVGTITYDYDFLLVLSLRGLFKICSSHRRSVYLQLFRRASEPGLDVEPPFNNLVCT